MLLQFLPQVRASSGSPSAGWSPCPSRSFSFSEMSIKLYVVNSCYGVKVVLVMVLTRVMVLVSVIVLVCVMSNLRQSHGGGN